jgi:ribonuclease HII
VDATDRDARWDVRRPRDPLDVEDGTRGRVAFRIAGVDEAGRGPLAGPVVAAAVVLPEGCRIEGARDSKRLTGKRRAQICGDILTRALAVGIGAASVREIDRINILRATALAMDRAVRALPEAPARILVDGLPVRGVGWTHEAIVRGDDSVHEIACASIVAKECRDRLMRRLSRRYPAFGWDTNMGYGTAGHLRALRAQGPTPHHRSSFGPVQVELNLGG